MVSRMTRLLLLLLIIFSYKVTARPDCNQKPNNPNCRSHDEENNSVSTAQPTLPTPDARRTVTDSQTTTYHPEEDTESKVAIALSVTVVVLLLLLLIIYVRVKRRQIWGCIVHKATGWKTVLYETNHSNTPTGSPSAGRSPIKRPEDTDQQDDPMYAEADLESEYEDTEIRISPGYNAKSTNKYDVLEKNRSQFRDKNYSRATANVKPFLIHYSHVNGASAAAADHSKGVFTVNVDSDTSYNKIGDMVTKDADESRRDLDITYCHPGTTTPEHSMREEPVDDYSHLDNTETRFYNSQQEKKE